jgi:hypothetical protein
LQLQIAYLGTTAAVGNFRADFQLRDDSSTPCQLTGWLGVQLVDAAGHSLPTQVTKSTSIFTGTAQAAPVELLPGLPQISSNESGLEIPSPGQASSSGYAYVSFSGGDEPVGPGTGGPWSCETAAGVEFTLPAAGGTLSVTTPTGTGIVSCPPGALSELPVSANLVFV